MQLLLVEDDIDLASGVIDYFELENIQCDHAANGVLALNLIETNYYDVVILDLNLPVMSGLDVCETLRNKGIDIPILMLTARDSLDDKLTGFAKGADDYLVKPFAMEELIMRVLVLSRRRSGQIKKLNVCGLALDTSQQVITRNSTPLKLSPICFKILEALMFAYPNPVSREKIMHSIWGDEQPDSNSLKVHMYNLRKIVDGGGDKVAGGKLIHTLVGHGFVLKMGECDEN